MCVDTATPTNTSTRRTNGGISKKRNDVAREVQRNIVDVILTFHEMPLPAL